MKRAVGFGFTEKAVQDLDARGFKSYPMSEKLTRGFRSHFFPLKISADQFDGFEIHIVHDEVEYLAFSGLKTFIPHVLMSRNLSTEPEHKNTVETFDSLVTPSELETSDLRSFLELRKPFSIAAISLRCRDMSEFTRIACPERVFDIQGRRAALIHLGPSCFDLLVRELGD